MCDNGPVPRLDKMRYIVRSVIIPMMAIDLILAGCGMNSKTARTAVATSGVTNGGETNASSPRSEEPGIAIRVTIPGLPKGRPFPKRYTCDGSAISLPVRWSGIPAGTAQLAMFFVNLKPVHGKLFFDWAVAGIAPTATGVAAGALPHGAVVGRNSSGKVGYSLCLPRGSVEEHFILRLFALSHPLAAKPGFDPEALYNEAERFAKVVGLAGAVYTKR